MFVAFQRSVVLLALLTALTGVAYPLLVAGVATVFFPDQASGSLVVRDGKVVGSRLLGRSFDDDPKYFWGRLSATSPKPYDAQASAGSNLGPTNRALTNAAKRRIDALHAADPTNTAPVPVDLVTSSGSGLDPHVSPAGARYQSRRVARARGIDEAVVIALVERCTEEKTFGVLGERRVDVARLNAALDDAR